MPPLLAPQQHRRTALGSRPETPPPQRPASNKPPNPFLSRTGSRPGRAWLSALLARARPRLHLFSGAELTQLAWGLAALRHPLPERHAAALMSAVMERPGERARGAPCPRPSVVAAVCPHKTACSLAPSKQTPYKHSRNNAPNTPKHCPTLSASLKAREWSILLWSLARLDAAPPPRWLAAAAASTWHRLRFFSAQDFANTAWALARLGATPGAPWRGRCARRGRSVCLASRVWARVGVWI